MSLTLLLRGVDGGLKFEKAASQACFAVASGDCGLMCFVVYTLLQSCKAFERIYDALCHFSSAIRLTKIAALV